MNDEIVIYQHKDLAVQIEAKIEEETIWLTQAQIVTLFESSKANISEHIKHIFQSGELTEILVVRKFRTTAADGKLYNIMHYSLDVIISVGYRVNSIRGTQFRLWANKILKDYLLQGYALNNRLNRIEDKFENLSNRVEAIDLQINSSLTPRQGIFFNGEVYDAYTLVSDIIRSANESIILIDNYIEDSVLTLLTKRKNDVAALIYTKRISKQLKLDLIKFNAQYPTIQIKAFFDSHDRFLIIDEKQLYHLGASLKDLGKKWFAFSRMDSLAGDVLSKLNQHEAGIKKSNERI